MSIVLAFKIIEKELPLDIIDKFNGNLSIEKQSRYSDQAFSIWQEEVYIRLKIILEGKMKISQGSPIHEWVEQKHNFFKEIPPEKINILWQACYIAGGIEKSFMINVKEKKYISYTRQVDKL